MLLLLPLRFLAIIVTLFSAGVFFFAPAYAHFFGATKQVDNYQIVFQPYPSSPIIGTNSTLNFSVLANDGNNLYNVYTSVVIADKRTGNPIYQEPYRLSEISDVTTRYRFDTPGDYVVTLQTRIPGDAKYASQPLAASFDVTAFPPGIPLDELLLYYVTPAAVVIAGIAVYLHSKNKI
ncbi:hypothetical protein NTE_02843 [Candidatus Nitrososphaera evergladensis SR1]|jgi:hypothetical protein|uniref:Uncharacterized protein n=2 Tax=Nitrososphaera TaxID=497726 RepID=A0A075MTF4_9ARCH|nr:hypothetical protein NTE_02843 [Candidatus Nitrososphaera evergladensis SR1]